MVGVTRSAGQPFVAESGTARRRNLQFTGAASDVVEGTVFAVTRRELEQADAFEPATSSLSFCVFSRPTFLLPPGHCR